MKFKRGDRVVLLNKELIKYYGKYHTFKRYNTFGDLDIGIDTYVPPDYVCLEIVYNSPLYKALE